MNKLLKGSKVINIIDNYDDINYELSDGINLVINIFCNTIKNHTINVLANNNNNLVINYAGLCSDNSDLNINIDVKGNNNKIIVNGRFISLNNLCNIIVDTKVDNNTLGNVIEENLKGINEDGMVMLKPILRIDTNEVNASHGASVGKFDKNELFYLKTKGLSEIVAKEILKKGFLYSLFSDNFIDLLQKGNEENE